MGIRKKIVLILYVYLGLFPLLFIHAHSLPVLRASGYIPTNFRSGSIDLFAVYLVNNDRTDKNGTAIKERIVIELENTTDTKDEFNSGDGFALSGNPYSRFSTVIQGGDRLSFDQRPYKERYAVDFPLYFEMSPDTAKDVWTVEVNKVDNHAATICRLMDTKDDDYPFEDLFLNNSTFTPGTPDRIITNADNSIKYVYERYRLRVYATCLFKKDAVSSDWDDERNWISGLLPGKKNGSELLNNAALIPASTTVTIKTNTSNLEIGTLLNGGTLEIESQAALKVLHTAELGSFINLY